eukprot:768772-Hanusia_phi.AAC.14
MRCLQRRIYHKSFHRRDREDLVLEAMLSCNQIIGRRQTFMRLSLSAHGFDDLKQNGHVLANLLQLPSGRLPGRRRRTWSEISFLQEGELELGLGKSSCMLHQHWSRLKENQPDLHCRSPDSRVLKDRRTCIALTTNDNSRTITGTDCSHEGGEILSFEWEENKEQVNVLTHEPLLPCLLSFYRPHGWSHVVHNFRLSSRKLFSDRLDDPEVEPLAVERNDKVRPGLEDCADG